MLSAHQIELASLARKLKAPHTTDEEVRQIFTPMKISTARELAQKHHALSSFVDLCGDAGVFLRPPEMSRLIPYFQQGDFPYMHRWREILSGFNKGVVQNYYWLAMKDVDRVGDYLVEQPDLIPYLKNPVRQLYGPETDFLPCTTEISRNGGEFRSIRPLAEGLMGIGFGGTNKRAINTLFDDPRCPVPVFGYSTRVKVFEYDVPEITNFIELRARELGFKL